MGRATGIWTSDVTDPPLNVLAGAWGIFVALAVGTGKLDFTWYAIASPLPLTLAAAVALARSLPRALMSGMGGCCLCLCIAVPLALIRAWGSMF